VSLLRSLGFTIHAEKSVLIPTQDITFLGFVLNLKILNLCLETIGETKISIIEDLLVSLKTLSPLSSPFHMENYSIES